MKDMRVLESEITIKSAMTAADEEALDALADMIAKAAIAFPNIQSARQSARACKIPEREPVKKERQ